MFGITSAIFLNDLIIWVLAASADVTVGTIMYKMLLHKWWWQKDVKQPWSFSIGNNGWSFSAQDFNPVETLRKAISHLLGNDRQIEEIVKEEIDRYLKENYQNFIDKAKINSIAKEKINEIVEKYLKGDIK